MINVSFERYKKFLPVVIVTVFALIFIGSIVRTTGAGMGCPDWPKCFGKLIPPTSVAELPADYKTLYKVGEREIADFSAFKTWTEYINRLFGVWTGIAISILLVLSLKIKKEYPQIFKLTLASFILVGLNGWLGSKVVSTHLAPGVITAHLTLALVLVFCLLKIKDLTFATSKIQSVGNIKNLSWMVFGAVCLQMLLGVQVREQIDHLTNNNHLDKVMWLDRLDIFFYIHRSFSILILLVTVVMLKKVMRSYQDQNKLQNLARNTLLVLITGIMTGAILVYFNFPSLFQSLHLVFSVILISCLFNLVISFAVSIDAKVEV